MTKLIAIGDIHGRTIWKDIVKNEKPSTVLFIGDYFDSYDISCKDQLNNFEEIMQFKEASNGTDVIMLWGNHEHHYMRDHECYSGYQHQNARVINAALNHARQMDYLDIAYSIDDLLFTHAGVSATWLKTHLKFATMDTLVVDLNILFRRNLSAFDFAGWSYTGDSEISSPIWIRHASLLRANKNHSIKKHFRQVVGHTMMEDINLESYAKWLGGRYIPIDGLAQGQYLIYDDKVLSVGQVDIT